ncbi:hypothetical protein [Pseudomonas sp. PA-1-3F]|uniref:hypothetical protein n=1 Tax=Pseudomonas sp. PA-1-3F TaxID=2665465 RepID=UPI001F42587A|nr:hypothetical protein [Pseudomonas sp. PA-1-3F]MCF5686837.1 hypothetical protein [Pseudomonas sp. PA-1-3F]
MTRIDLIWLATEPMDIRTGTEEALARVVDSIWLATGPMDMRAALKPRWRELSRYSVRRSRTVLICLPTVVPIA